MGMRQWYAAFVVVVDPDSIIKESQLLHLVIFKAIILSRSRCLGLCGDLQCFEHADKTALGIVEYEVVALSSAESNTVVSGIFLETTSRGELHTSDMRQGRSRECQEQKEAC